MRSAVPGAVAHPTSVCASIAPARTVTYDFNGNQTAGVGRSISYTSYKTSARDDGGSARRPVNFDIGAEPGQTSTAGQAPACRPRASGCRSMEIDGAGRPAALERRQRPTSGGASPAVVNAFRPDTPISWLLPAGGAVGVRSGRLLGGRAGRPAERIGAGGHRLHWKATQPQRGPVRPARHPPGPDEPVRVGERERISMKDRLYRSKPVRAEGGTLESLTPMRG